MARSKSLGGLLVGSILIVAVLAGTAVAGEAAGPGPYAEPSLPAWASTMPSAGGSGPITPKPNTNAEAAEGMPRNDLGRAEASDLVTAVFGDVLDDATGIYDDIEVKRFHSDHVAIVAPGRTASPAKGEAQPGLLTSVLPLRTENSDGVNTVVDLDLRYADGVLRSENPLVEVEIPAELGEGISLPESGVTINLQEAPQGRAPSTVADATAFYPNVAPDSDLTVVPIATGVETSTILRTPDAPLTQVYELTMPSGARIELSKDGGASVVKAGSPLLTIPRPTAMDAAGDPVPVSLKVADDSIEVQVSPSPTVAYPVLVDPIFESYYWDQYAPGPSPEWALWASPGGAFSASWNPYSGGILLGSFNAVTTPGSQAMANYYVPRFFTDFNDPAVNARPTSYIKNMTMTHMYFAVNNFPEQQYPVMQLGIWSENKGQWVSYGRMYSNEAANLYPTYVFNMPNPDEVTDAKNAGISLSTAQTVSYWRTVGVGQATVEISDKDSPNFGQLGSASGWLHNEPTAVINYSVVDPGLGVHELQVRQPNATGGSSIVKTPVGCLGSARGPCPRVVKAADKALGYSPATMPQGEHWLKVTATDPVLQKSSAGEARVRVDHTAPKLTLSGSITEQGTVGHELPAYTLSYNASDGDTGNPQPLSAIGSAGTGAGQFQRPAFPALDASGNLYVSDRLNNRITKFGPDGDILLQFGSLGSGNGQLNDPRGIAISESGNVWVADFANKRVQQFSPSGTFISKIDLPGGIGGTPGPYAVATGPNETLWIVDQTQKKVSKYKEDGTLLGKVEGTQSFPIVFWTDLLNPVGAAVDGFGNVWVVDQGNSKVREFSSAGKFLFEFGTQGTGAGELNHPRGIAIAPSGNLLITDESHRVQEFRPDGSYLGRSLGSSGAGSGQLLEPQGLAIGPENTLYVGDAGNKRVARWAHADLDQQSGVRKVEIKVDGQTVRPPDTQECGASCPLSGEWTLDAGDYSVGQHSLEVIATDGVELSAKEELTVETNIVPPKISVSGTMTEQAELGPARPTYKLKVDASAGPGVDKPPPSETPVAAYPLDAGEGSLAEDAFAEHNGVIDGAAWAANGRFGKALSFDGEDDCVTVEDAPDLQLTEELTLEAWVKPQGDGVSEPIIFKETPWFVGYSLYFGIFENGHMEAVLGQENWTFKTAEDSEELDLNVWSHVALTFDGANLRLYVNGELVDTTKAEGAMATGGPLSIGCSVEFEDNYEGLIDEVRIYDRALSQEEIEADKNRAVQGQSFGTRSEVSTEITVDGQVVDTGQASCPDAPCPISREWDLDATAYSPGSHQVVAKVTDGLGATRSKTLTVDIAEDTTAPTITAANAFYNAPEGWVEQKSYAANATGKDEAGYGVTSMTLKIDGDVVRSSSQECSAGGCNLQMSLGQPIDMTEYDGGAHPAELRVADGAGNVAKKDWTINVSPEGTISTSEAEQTLEAFDETGDLITVGEDEPDEVTFLGGDLEFELAGGEYVVPEAGAPTTLGTDAADGLMLPIPTAEALAPSCPLAEQPQEEDEASEDDPEPSSYVGGCEPSGESSEGIVALEPVKIEPVAIGSESTDPVLSSEDLAAISANLTKNVDQVVRPLYNGAQTFMAIRNFEAPENYSFAVRLEEDQQLKQIDARSAGVFYPTGQRAVLIEPTAAHDAIGTELPTTITVNGDDEIVLHVPHRSPSPVGGSYVYPVVGGAGWEGGFQTYAIEMPAAAEPAEDLNVMIGESEDGVSIHLGLFGAPFASASSSGKKEFPFRFSDCRYGWFKKLPQPVPPTRRENLIATIGGCAALHDGDIVDEFTFRFGVTVYGVLNIIPGKEVWVEREPEKQIRCKSWGRKNHLGIEMRAAVVNCYAAPWRAKAAGITLRGDFRANSTATGVINNATCMTPALAVYPVKPYKELRETHISLKPHGEYFQACDWP